MSRAAQEMQRIADEMKRRRPTKKGRPAVDDLEDITEGEPAPAAPAQDAPPAAAAEEAPVAKSKKAAGSKSASAVRSKAWRDRKRREARKAAGPGEKTMVKTKSESGKYAFVSCSTAMALEAFTLLLDSTEQARTAAAGTDAEQAITEKAKRLQAIVDRLGA